MSNVRPHVVKHLVLVGDSILDNASYTAGGPAVIAQVQEQLPNDWKATLSAVDGSTTEEIPAQLAAVPQDATHLLLCVGGNNALMQVQVLEAPVASSGEAFVLLSEVVREFESAYRSTVDACLAMSLPLVVCTVYNCNFPDPVFQKRATVALTAFNDVIIRVAIDRHLRVIDLRLVCASPEDYANPIEPSSIGGAKIARAIVRAVTTPQHKTHGAHVVGVA